MRATYIIMMAGTCTTFIEYIGECVCTSCIDPMGIIVVIIISRIYIIYIASIQDIIYVINAYTISFLACPIPHACIQVTCMRYHHKRSG